MRLIDADRLIDEFEDTVGSPIARTRLKLQVQNQPTIDAVEVVRCKDCKWHTDNFCNNFNVIGFGNDDFCSKAERFGYERG